MSKRNVTKVSPYIREEFGKFIQIIIYGASRGAV
jgi:hypothetical protein